VHRGEAFRKVKLARSLRTWKERSKG
jgi:hypothetical protein